jgi:hypothetical protein
MKLNFIDVHKIKNLPSEKSQFDNKIQKDATLTFSFHGTTCLNYKNPIHSSRLKADHCPLHNKSHTKNENRPERCMMRTQGYFEDTAQRMGNFRHDFMSPIEEILFSLHRFIARYLEIAKRKE